MAKKKMSVKEMQAEVTRLEKEIKVAAQQEAVEEIVGSPEFKIVHRKFAKLGTSPQVIGKLFAGTRPTAGTAPKTPGKVPPKYKHPRNSKLLWTGRGKKPLWVRECLEEGLTLEDLLIKK